MADIIPRTPESLLTDEEKKKQTPSLSSFMGAAEEESGLPPIQVRSLDGGTTNVGGEVTPIQEPTVPVVEPKEEIIPAAEPTMEPAMTAEDLQEPVTQEQPTQQAPGQSGLVEQQRVDKVAQTEVDPNATRLYIDSAKSMNTAIKNLAELNVLSPEETKQFIKASARVAALTDPNSKDSVTKQYIDRVNETKGEISRVIADIKDLNTKEVDPERYLKEEVGVGTKVMAVLDALATSFLKSRGRLQQDATSLADRIKMEIREDINKQYAEIKNNKKDALTSYEVLNRELQQHSSDFNARLAAESKALLASKNHIDNLISQRKLEGEALAQAEKLSGQLGMSVGKTLMEMGQKSLVSTVNKAKLNTSTQNKSLVKDIKQLNDEMYNRTIKMPVYNDRGNLLRDRSGNPITVTRVFGKDTEMQAPQEKIGSIRMMMDILDKVDSLRDETGNIALSGPQVLSEIKSKLNSYGVNMQMIEKDTQALGALAGPDLDLLKQLIADPTMLSDTKYDAKAEVAREIIMSKLKTLTDTFNINTPQEFIAKRRGRNAVDVYTTDYLKDVLRAERTRANRGLTFSELKEMEDRGEK